MGGKFADGFMSGAFGSFANTVGDGFSWKGFAKAVVAGGVGSVLGGGKFKNGAVTAAFGYMFNSRLHGKSKSLAETGIPVDDEFTFTEQDARNTITAWASRAGDTDMIEYVNSVAQLSDLQMQAAFELAVNMTTALEASELLGKIHAAGGSLKGIISVIRSEGSIRSELFEHVRENWTDLDTLFPPWAGSVAISAGRVYMKRADRPEYLFRKNGEERYRLMHGQF
jgi:hypothetical protein